MNSGIRCFLLALIPAPANGTPTLAPRFRGVKASGASYASTMSVHWRAAEGFGRAAAAYERGRPGYPQAALDWMVERLGITPGSTVVDLGAGTGKFSRM